MLCQCEKPSSNPPAAAIPKLRLRSPVNPRWPTMFPKRTSSKSQSEVPRTRPWSPRSRPRNSWMCSPMPGPSPYSRPPTRHLTSFPRERSRSLLKPENKDKLADILQYHVAVGGYKEDMLTDGKTLNMANGGNVKVTVKDGKITLNGTATRRGTVLAVQRNRPCGRRRAVGASQMNSSSESESKFP